MTETYVTYKGMVMRYDEYLELKRQEMTEQSEKLI